MVARMRQRWTELHCTIVGVGEVATLFLHGTVGTNSSFEFEQCAIGTAFASIGPDQAQDGGSLGECTPSLVRKDAHTLKTVDLVVLVANELGAVFGTEHLELHQDIGIYLFIVQSDGLTCHPVVEVSGVVDGTAFLCGKVYGVQAVTGHKFVNGSSIGLDGG
jgi:hypothetical protein